ncbi:hypothetical protein DSC45_11070 [Streptomyces sp. YIM 130001]|uniref:ATP-binding protein n=1 Tax=Streptomyces sp. YIM 130001 TaxID=2259644 RepID=UPI000ED0135B|nr:hypothetical protein DSC45_11070 [Streptomyces sp. YIM 130001]
MALGNASTVHHHAGTVVGDRRCRFELAARADSVASARRLARHHLTRWSIGDDTCETAALVISELVTNAVVHTGSEQIVCELADDSVARTLRIVVRDEGCADGTPSPHPSRAGDDDHGRGLLLVSAVSKAWGAQEAAGGLGLVVWADLAREGEPGCV